MFLLATPKIDEPLPVLTANATLTTRFAHY